MNLKFVYVYRQKLNSVAGEHWWGLISLAGIENLDSTEMARCTGSLKLRKCRKSLASNGYNQYVPTALLASDLMRIMFTVA